MSIFPQTSNMHIDADISGSSIELEPQAPSIPDKSARRLSVIHPLTLITSPLEKPLSKIGTLKKRRSDIAISSPSGPNNASPSPPVGETKDDLVGASAMERPRPRSYQLISPYTKYSFSHPRPAPLPPPKKSGWYDDDQDDHGRDHDHSSTVSSINSRKAHSAEETRKPENPWSTVSSPSSSNPSIPSRSGTILRKSKAAVGAVIPRSDHAESSPSGRIKSYRYDDLPTQNEAPARRLTVMGKHSPIGFRGISLFPRRKSDARLPAFRAG
ncbi:hypothetical protein GQ43DRAFT_471463 [Delitschia confertaspora ATCC 74209]|uniref:Uncharacterized protein n=1 Tax=Delitschia confertaspora ATCC 74209 TaxID=1513339 RepID=A0A9P4MW52_9PLEO|nr:hypothetical protein GQ43DRAFT_471463 [Delitschia confertaspora ATCC 74209]